VRRRRHATVQSGHPGRAGEPEAGVPGGAIAGGRGDGGDGPGGAGRGTPGVGERRSGSGSAGVWDRGAGARRGAAGHGARVAVVWGAGSPRGGERDDVSRAARDAGPGSGGVTLAERGSGRTAGECAGERLAGASERGAGGCGRDRGRTSVRRGGLTAGHGGTKRLAPRHRLSPSGDCALGLATGVRGGAPAQGCRRRA